jgi:enediyne biosynthesis protein E4
VRRAAAGLGALLVLAAACSSGDDAASTTTAAPTTAPAPTTTPPSPGGGPACWTGPVTPGEGPITLTDGTEAAGLIDPLLGMYGHGSAFGDVNADGWVDLFVGTFADRPAEEYQVRGAEGPAADQLLLGGPDGFTPDPTFPEMRSRTSGAVFADLDGDADLDLVLARNAGDNPIPSDTVLLENTDEGWGEPAPLLPELGARSIGVLDYDGDGALDMFVSEDRFADGSSVLLHNDGGLSFSVATGAAGLPDDLDGLGVAVADLDADGDPDLFVSDSNLLFANDGGTFREVDSSAFAWEPVGEEDDLAGVAVADLNRDGRLDLVVGQHFNSTLDADQEVPVRIYLNDGDLSFRDVTEASGVPALPTKAPHVELADLDDDGWPDLVTSASAADGALPAVLHHEGLDDDGVPQFSTPEGLGADQYWVTGGTADVDRDGHLDLFLVDFLPANPSLLFHNETAGGHWVSVEVGVAGTGGAGDVVEVYRAGGLGQPEALLGARPLMATQGYGAGAWPAAHFGVGEETQVDLRVVRPGGQPPIDLTGVAVDRHLRIGPEGLEPCS